MGFGKLKNFNWQRKKTLVPGGFVALGLIVIFVFGIFAGNASAAVTIATSTDSAATANSNQRKTWWDGSRYWAAYHDLANTRIDFYYSTNGSSWTEDTSARISLNTADFSIEADSTNAFLVVANGTSVSTYRACTTTLQAGCSGAGAVLYPNIGFIWGTTTAAFVCSTSCAQVGISRDSNSKVVVDAYNSGVTKLQSNLSSSANDISAWGSVKDIATTLSPDTNTIATGANGNLVSTYNVTTTLKSRHINGSASAWDSNAVNVAKVTTGATNNESVVSNPSASEDYLSYIDTSGKTTFKKFDDATIASNTTISSGLGTIPAGGRNLVRDSTGNIYAAVNAAGTCEIWKSANNGTSFSEIDSGHHPTCASATPVALAVDSTNKLHFAYFSTGSAVKYIQVASDTYGSIEAASSNTFANGIFSLDIAVDSSNIPHIIASGLSAPTSNELIYNNRITSNAWKNSDIIVDSGIASQEKSISLSFAANIPIISWIDFGNAALDASVGNANNAASFTKQVVDGTVNATVGQFGSSIAVDSSGNTWIAYSDATSTNQMTIVEHLAASGWSTWQTPIASTDKSGEPSIAIYDNIIYVLFQNTNAANVSYDEYNVDIGAFGGVKQIVSAGQNVHAHWALNAGNSSSYPIDLLYSNAGDVNYYQQGVWQPPVTLDSNAGNTNTSISYDAANNNLYSFWLRSNTVQCNKGVSPFTTSSNWGACPGFTGYGTGTNTQLTAGALRNGANGIPMIWTNGSGSPFNVDFDSLGFNSPPGAPSVSTTYVSGIPDATTVSSTTPAITLNATDADSDNVKYNFVITQTSANSGGLCTGTSQESSNQNGGASTGWSNGSGPATQGTNVTYTIQSALTRGSVYCMQAEAIDPSGSNTFGSWSTPIILTVDAAPAAPTLISPASSATNISITPLFRLRTTDADSDYVRYRIYLYASDCSTVIGSSPFTEPTGLPQTGWGGQDQQSSTAYGSSSSIGSSIMASYTYQGTLLPNTTYCWKADAIDPGGANTYGNPSSTQTFTTATYEVNINGGVNIRGGTTIQ